MLELFFELFGDFIESSTSPLKVFQRYLKRKRIWFLLPQSGKNVFPSCLPWRTRATASPRVKAAGVRAPMMTMEATWQEVRTSFLKWETKMLSTWLKKRKTPSRQVEHMGYVTLCLNQAWEKHGEALEVRLLFLAEEQRVSFLFRWSSPSTFLSSLIRLRRLRWMSCRLFDGPGKGKGSGKSSGGKGLWGFEKMNLDAWKINHSGRLVGF